MNTIGMSYGYIALGMVTFFSFAAWAISAIIHGYGAKATKGILGAGLLSIFSVGILINSL